MNHPYFFWFTAAFTHNGHVCATDKKWVTYGGTRAEWNRQNRRALKYGLDFPSTPITRPEVTISGAAQKYPAILNLQDDTKSFMVREDVADAIRSSELTGFDFDSVYVENVISKRLRSLPQPKYYALVGLGHVDYTIGVYKRHWTPTSDKVEFQFAARNHDDPAFQAVRNKGNREYEFAIVPDESTWDGSDFFRVKGYRSGIYPLACSFRFLELAGNNDWDNFAFNPIDSFGSSQEDFRKRNWPPSCWYPSRHPHFKAANTEQGAAVKP